MAVTLDQKRARHAWEAIAKAKKLTKAKEYGGHAKKMPARILNAGLGPALAFLNAKAGPPGTNQHKKHLGQLHEDLTAWVVSGRGLKGQHPKSLLNSVIDGDATFLRLATDEVLAYLQWLNRFAEAEGLTDDDQSEDGGY